MVTKTIAFLIMITFLSSCCYNGKVSTYGLPRKKIEPLEMSASLSGIDTLCLYKNKINFSFNKSFDSYNYYEKDDQNTYPYASYLKFYAKGKVGLFIVDKKDTLRLQRSFFDPSRAKMGYYSIKGSNIEMKISTIGDCTLYISQLKGTIKGDEIIVESKNHQGNIYTKKQVAQELLKGWNPDW